VRQAVRTEKFRALGQLASDVAHDLNQSLALAAGYSDLAQQALEQDPPDFATLRESFRLVAQAALDGGETVKRLLLFSRSGSEGDPVPVDLSSLVQEV